MRCETRPSYRIYQYYMIETIYRFIVNNHNRRRYHLHYFYSPQKGCDLGDRFGHDGAEGVNNVRPITRIFETILSTSSCTSVKGSRLHWSISSEMSNCVRKKASRTWVLYKTLIDSCRTSLIWVIIKGIDTDIMQWLDASMSGPKTWLPFNMDASV